MFDIFLLSSPRSSFSPCLSVLRSLMWGSHWYYSSQSTSGGASPTSLHVRSGARMQFLVPLFPFYPSTPCLKESRPRAWSFFFFLIHVYLFILSRRYDRKTQESRSCRSSEGEEGEQTVCKHESFHHVRWRFVCFCLAGRPPSIQRSRLTAAWLAKGKQTADTRTWRLFFVCFFALPVLVCLFAFRLHACTAASANSH